MDASGAAQRGSRAQGVRWTAAEQKLGDAFRKPSRCLQRKGRREKAATQLSEHDRAVLEASKALEVANASGDAQKIRAAMATLDAALRGQAQAVAAAQAQQGASHQPKDAGMAVDPEAAPGTSLEAHDAQGDAGAAGSTPEAPAPAPAAAPKPAPKPVVAMRGDDGPA